MLTSHFDCLLVVSGSHEKDTQLSPALQVLMFARENPRMRHSNTVTGTLITMSKCAPSPSLSSSSSAEFKGSSPWVGGEGERGGRSEGGKTKEGRKDRHK